MLANKYILIKKFKRFQDTQTFVHIKNLGKNLPSLDLLVQTIVFADSPGSVFYI